MKTRTWPYSTRYLVKITDVKRTPATQIITAELVTNASEAFVLVLATAHITALYHHPRTGQRRVIEFRRGGPKGGYWALLDGLRDPGPGTCRVCGCIELDCAGCIKRTGQPCHWVEPDLCSACVPVSGGRKA